MPRVPRITLDPAFRKAVLADRRGIIKLAALAGFPAYTGLSRLLPRGKRLAGTALTQSRLRTLAQVLGFAGKPFRG